MTLKPEFRRSAMLAGALALLAAISLTAFGASPARADRCDDIAAQLKGQIDGLKVGITAANVIYLSHPPAKELSLGCRGRNYTNELYAKADSRKPKPEFLELVATRGGHRLHHPEARRAHGRDALHQADGAVPRRQCHDALPPPRHGMHPHQDRGVDRDLARQGRVEDAKGRRPAKSSAYPLEIAIFSTMNESSVHHVTGIAPMARGLRSGFIKHSSPPRHCRAQRSQGSCPMSVSEHSLRPTPGESA